MALPTDTTTSKSGMRTLQPGELLFKDGDVADSLYIIQNGQIRLFKPKGKGFIEIGMLRSGEVIGEMAFFDEDGSGKKRSCSAAALTTVEIIEISFSAFGKTMSGLNPWFKMIINTLVSRLRKANIRTKELESNQASVSYGDKAATYEFMKPIEIIRVLGTLFLVFKGHGEVKGQALMVGRKTVNLYTNDLYQIMEVKLESILALLVQVGLLEIQNDSDQNPNIFLLKDIEALKQIFIYYNSERHMQDHKKMRVSVRCEMVIAKMIEDGAGPEYVSDIPNLRKSDDNPVQFTKQYYISPIIQLFKAKGINISADHLSDGKNIGIFGEPMIVDGKTYIEVDYPKVKKMYPIIRFMNALKKSNQEKGGPEA